MNREELKSMPKVELHCHLDGSLSRDFMEKRLGLVLSDSQISVNHHCRSLNEYLEKFQLPIKCIQDRDGLEGAGYDVLRTMSREHVVYAEIRFAPLLSVSESLDTRNVIEALLAGLQRGREDFGIEFNIITCAMRHHSEKENLQMLKTAREYLGSGVCAADLAGAEAVYPMADFMELFREVKRLDMPFTLHAGETGNIQNVRDAVEAGASRIGHGIAMRGDASLQRLVQTRNIGIEMCPISNLQTKASAGKAEYPLQEFLEAGIPVSINTDNRTVSGTSVTDELDFIQRNYGISDEEIVLLQKNAVQTAFADDALKQKLQSMI